MPTEPMFLQILETTISPNRNELEAAEKYLEHAAVTNFTTFMKMLSDVLAQGGNSQVARMAAGLQLKNHLTSKDVTLKQQYQQRWLALPEETRLYIKKNILAAICTEERPTSAAQCVAYVALAEFPVGQWNELIPSLLVENFVTAQATELKKEAITEAAINETYLNLLLESLVNGLEAEPRVAASVCWAFHSLAEAAYEAADCGDSNQPKTYCMSNYFDLIIQRLLETTDRQDAAQHSLRCTAYEALMEMVKNSPSDCYVTAQNTTMVIWERLQQMENHISSQADRSQFNDLQGFLCYTFTAVLRKATPEDAPQISDAVMTALLTMFASNAGEAGGVQEDALMAVTTLVEVLGEGFLKYMDAFKRYLYVGLKNHQEYQVCIAAVELTGYICRVLDNKVLPYCDEIMLLLVETLGDPSVHRLVKPRIFSVFGDIALSVGPDFAKYFDVVMQMLLQASNAQVDRNDFAMVKYSGELRESVLEAYNGIIWGLGGGGEGRADVAPRKSHVPAIVNLMMAVAAEPARSDRRMAVVARLAGDLCAVFGARALPLLEQPPLLDLLAHARRSRAPTTKELADRATEEIRELEHQPPPAWSI